MSKSLPTTDAQIKSLVTAGNPSLHKIERNLYLRVTKPGTGFWVFQYTLAGKPHRMTLGRYGRRPEGMPLVDAREALIKSRAQFREGIDPLSEKRRTRAAITQTVDDVAELWLKEVRKNITNHHIPERIYRKEISPLLGKMSITRVTGLDINNVLSTVKDSGRPCTANDTLTHLKQLFHFANKLGLISVNPALSFKISDAGGAEKSRERALSKEDIAAFFSVARKHRSNFTRENYLAVALLLVLLVRKTELTSAPWREFDLDAGVWHLPAERAKTEVAIAIPLPHQAIEWLKELKIRAAGSDYVFPSRRKSSRPYISDDTLNAALANLFGKSTRPTGSTTGDVLTPAGVEHFVVHDLRRTGRTLMASLKINSQFAEKCLNHNRGGKEKIYDRWEYFDERKEAHQMLADLIAPYVDLTSSDST